MTNIPIASEGAGTRLDSETTAQPIYSGHGRLSTRMSLAFLAPLVILFAWTFVLPIATFLTRSFTQPTLSLSNYIHLASEPLYITTILRTIKISLFTVLITLLLGYPIATLMARLRGISGVIVAACVVVPLWTSVLVRSYAWIVILQRKGIVNTALLESGAISQPLRLLYTETAVLMAMAHVLLPFVILPIYATLRNIPPDLEKAALNLGASRLRAFLAVTLPLSMPGVLTGCVLVFVLSLGFYITPALVGGPQTLMIATLIGQQATGVLNWPMAAAISTVLLILALGVTVIFRKMMTIEKVAG